MPSISEKILCPSAQPEMADCVAFGVVQGTSTAPRLTHLAELQPMTDELLALTQPVALTEVFRFAAPCAQKGCRHFDGQSCGLATQIVEALSPVVAELPPCQIRLNCRWWQQEGIAACLRCPQVVTDIYLESIA